MDFICIDLTFKMFFSGFMFFNNTQTFFLSSLALQNNFQLIHISKAFYKLKHIQEEIYIFKSKKEPFYNFSLNNNSFQHFLSSLSFKTSHQLL
jgi:hypothetical protein